MLNTGADMMIGIKHVTLSFQYPCNHFIVFESEVSVDVQSGTKTCM